MSEPTQPRTPPPCPPWCALLPGHPYRLSAYDTLYRLHLGQERYAEDVGDYVSAAIICHEMVDGDEPAVLTDPAVQLHLRTAPELELTALGARAVAELLVAVADEIDALAAGQVCTECGWPNGTHGGYCSRANGPDSGAPS